MAALAAESQDIVITSPPYNLDIKYGSYEDDQPRDQYLAWLNDVFLGINRVLKPRGHLFLNMGYSNIDPWVGHDVAALVRKFMVLQNNFIWVKSIAIEDKQMGRYKPINSERFANPTWEHLYHFTKTGDIPCDKTAIGVPYADKANLDKSGRWRGRMIKKLGFENKREFDAKASDDQKAKLVADLLKKTQTTKPPSDLHCPGNAWYIPYDTITNRSTNRGTHPATFPVELARRAIRFSGATGTLLDPFMGTGTSGVAATLEGLDYLGFDIDASYVKFAEQRILESKT
jgi:site-specific DNA-methyltransferase (adenine-specific)